MSMPVSASLAALSSPPGPEQPSAVPMPASCPAAPFAVPSPRRLANSPALSPAPVVHSGCDRHCFSLGSDLLAQGLSFLTTLYGPRISLQRANSNNSSEVWVGLLVEVLVLNVLHRLTQAHRVSRKNSAIDELVLRLWSVAWVYFWHSHFHF